MMVRASTNVRPLTDLLWALIGPAVWFAHLAVVYGAEALICTEHMAMNARFVSWAVAVTSLATLAALTVLAATLVRLRPTDSRTLDRGGAEFLRSGTLLLVLLSMLGVIWTTMPVAFLPACASSG
jgi:hypothetical protein